jgi:hypothetical protein
LIHVRRHVTRHTSWWAAIDMCLFVGPDTRRREDLADRFPMRKVRPFLCLAGRFYLQFELGPSYDPDSSQGLRESPAISVLIACKIQHTQSGSVPVVLSVAFPLFSRSVFSPNGGLWKLKSSELLKCELLTLIFSKELLISQNWDKQPPPVKLHSQHAAINIYRLISRNQHLYVVCGRERSKK